MSAVVVAGGVAGLADVEPLRARPDLRKATTPMLLALAALGRCLQAIPQLSLSTRESWGLIVGVDYGELEVTKEFLRTLATRGIARPLLFQSALHNAALGFLSRQLGVHGPGATVSTRWFAGEDALSLAVDLIDAQDCEMCLCVGMEHIDVDMRAAVSAVRGPDAIGDGGGAVLLASPAAAARHEQRVLASLQRIDYIRRPDAVATAPGSSAPPGFFGSDAILRLVEALAADSSISELRLTKPDGSWSRMALVADPGPTA